MFKPKVSIVIPVYNWSNYLWEAIESALNQTYDNIEILVINDWSNDNWATEKVALSFGDKIKYYKKDNWGVSTALNLGIEKMTWEYFSWLSHDDLYYPNKIEEQVKFLEWLDDKNSIISCNIEKINNKWNLIEKCNLSYKSNELLYILTKKWIINWCTLLISKYIFNKIGLFDDKLRTTQDYDMWVRILARYSFKHLNLCLVKSRVHNLQDSFILKDLWRYEKIKIQKKIFKYFTIMEIKKSSWSKSPKFIFFIKIYIFYYKNLIIYMLIILTKKLWLYNMLSSIWRKFL